MVGWGRNDYGQIDLPSGLTNVVALARGDFHSLALKDDGTVVAWGENAFGETDVPPGLTNAVAIAASTYDSMALRSDGTVLAWGDNGRGQTNVPIGLTNVVAIASDGDNCVVLQRDGTVIGWGDTDFLPPAGLSNVVAIGRRTALKNDGTLVTWGYGGQLASPSASSNFVSFSEGLDFGLALKANGTVIGWGSNDYGQTNVPSGLTGVLATAAGDNNSLALLSGGTVVGWGYNANGMHTVPAELTIATSHVVSIFAGPAHYLALNQDGGVVAWGENFNGETNVPPGLTNVIAISGGYGFSLALVNDGTPGIVWQSPSQTLNAGLPAVFSVRAVGPQPLAYQWQFNGTNLVGATDKSLALAKVQIGNQGVYNVVVSNFYGAISSSNVTLTVVPAPPTILVQPASQPMVRGGNPTFGVVAAGSDPLSYQWQFNGTNIAGATNPQLALTGIRASDAGNYQVTVSNVHGLMISSNAALTLVPSLVVAWGYDYYGQTNVPAALTNATSIAAGGFHSLAADGNGKVFAWGAGMTNGGLNPNYGQSIVSANATNKVVAIAGGGLHSLALNQSGRVIAWGDNSSGQTAIPTGLSNVVVVAIAAGRHHNLALKSDGTVAAWGDNSYNKAEVPAGLTNIIAVAGGNDHSLALNGGGKIFAWGDNYYGQTNTPSDLVALAVAAGGYHSLALKTDGTVVAWGDNSRGQTRIPAGLSNVVAIAAGAYHSIALKSDGTVVTWGAGLANDPLVSGYDYGQSIIPKGLTNVIAISGGWWHTLALINDGSPAVVRTIPNQTTTNGLNVTFRIDTVSPLPVSYQWQFNGTNIVGATNSLLTLTNVPLGSAGSYQCMVSNLNGSASSSSVMLNVMRSIPQFYDTSFANAGFNLHLNGFSGHGPVVIYASTNLQDWRSIFTNPPTTGTLQFLDSSATNRPLRFYRAIEQ